MSVPTVILDHLVSATEEVFETMLFTPLERRPPITGSLETPANIVASVAFAGHRKGLVAVYASTSAATRITSGLLGIPAQEVNGEVPDAMGEIANMVAGTFRNRLAQSEPSSEIAVPTVTIGTDFCTVYSSAASRVRCPFLMEGEALSVELILMGEQPAA
ncbi:MAG: chemotaxis protein CheX [Vicinamibacterales bacterium]